MMRGVFGAVAAVLGALTLAFLLLPVVAVLTRNGPGELWDLLRGDVATDALLVSLQSSLVASALILVLGTPIAYVIGIHRRFPGRDLLITLIELPLVMPPVVAGVGLLAAFGRVGLLGEELSALGVTIPFTRAAVVLAVAFVASPFYLRQAIAAFEALDPDLLDAARSLGAPPGRTFWRVALPLASGGLAAGWALAFARGLGEFGATIIFAGNLQGVTQTLPLAVYSEFERDFDAALAIGSLLIVVSAAILLCVKLVGSWTHLLSPSSSTSPAVTSA